MSKQTYTLLNAATATGAGTAIDVVPGMNEVLGRNTPYLNAKADISDTGGATQITVAIEISEDNVNWYTAVVHDYTLAGTSVAVPNNHARYIRANLLTLTAGTAPTVTVTVTIDR